VFLLRNLARVILQFAVHRADGGWCGRYRS
jgi:hypothetical protein